MAKETYSLWPREHGAYVQLAVALACGVALGRGSRGVAQAVLTAALFLASEPVLVLLGRRGEPAREAAQVRAALRLLLLGSLAILAALAAWVGTPALHLLALLLPTALAAGLFGLFLARRERTAPGELVAAWAFSASAGCVALLGGGGGRRAWILGLLLAGMFSLATAIVHGHFLATRRGGAWAPRAAAFALGLALAAAAGYLGRGGRLLWAGPGALLPMTLAALWVWLAPPAPRQLKRVGWVATASAVAGGLVAVWGLWRQ